VHFERIVEYINLSLIYDFVTLKLKKYFANHKSIRTFAKYLAGKIDVA